MARLVVGVLRGGTSDQYDRSLKTGARMLATIPEEKYEVRDIFIDRGGQWHLHGRPMDPGRILPQLDVALSGLVDTDAETRRTVMNFGVPLFGHTARSPLTSSSSPAFRSVATNAGILVPQSIELWMVDDATSAEYAQAIFSRFAPPYLVTPPTGYAREGTVRIARHIADLPDAIADVLDAFGAAIVQELVDGTDAEVGILENFRGQDLYAFPPVRLLAPDERPSADVRHLVPSDFTDEEKQQLMALARAAHRALGHTHFSHARFRFAGMGAKRHGRPYLLGIEPFSELHEEGTFPSMLEAVGSSVQEFLEHAIQLARSR